MNLEEEIRLGRLSKEQLKFMAFRTIFENSDEVNQLEWFDENCHNYQLLSKPENIYLLPSIHKGDLFKQVNSEFIKIKENDFGITDLYYPEILKKMTKLSLELGLKNSLELSNLYTYLLWNGYFSKTKLNLYSIENRKIIIGLLFADIMDGIGVCLNHADMLKDFLNNSGYDAAVMVNLVTKNTKNDYKINIERKVKEAALSTKILHFVMKPLINKIGNHAFTLIKDNGRLYIYDSTNLRLLELKTPYVAEVINGEGIHKLHPYTSCLIGTGTKKEINAISGLFEMSDLSSPYSRSDFVYTCERNMELFNDSVSLLDDFYDDIRSDIIAIADATNKIDAKKRQRRKK